MIYRKIENFIGSHCEGGKEDMGIYVFVILFFFLLVLSPVLIPVYFISKFYHAPND